MIRKTFKLAGLLMFLTGFNNLQAQNTDPINVVTTAVPFLRISPDARAGGMGELGVATSADANSSFYNLAKTPFAKTPYGVGLTYTPWLKDLGLNDVYLMALAGYYKLDDLSALSGSVRYFSLGNITFTDYNAIDNGTFRPREFGVDVGYSRKLSDRMSLGIALRYISSNLTGGGYSNGLTTYKPGSAVAGDVSFFYTGADESGQGWNFGVAVTNLGTKIGYTNDATQKDYIPANLSFGANYTKVFDENNKMSFGLETSKLMVPTPPTFTNDPVTDSTNIAAYRNKSVVNSWFSSFSDAPGGASEEFKEFQFALGTEYSYNEQFFVRLGYFYEHETKGARKYVTAGLGLKYNVFGLNFSYLVPSGQGVNRNPLSNTLRFGLVLDIAGGDEQE
ncbi:type IX secretion system outer membrane channel protein PorV [Flavitalea antarctica]